MAITKLLRECPLPRDALPYSPEFPKFHSKFAKLTDLKWEERDLWEAITTIAKPGGFAGKTGRKTAPRTPSLTEEEQLEVLRLCPEGIGNRDRYPYTPRFDELHARFRKLTGRQLSKHEFWRAFSRVAKLSRKPKPLFDTAPLGGLARDLVLLLEKTNPWWCGDPTVAVERFRRWAFDETLERLDADVAPVVAIRGPRQVGKTTIQRQIIEYLLRIRRVGPERILRVQFDEVPALGSLRSPIDTIVRWYEDNVLRERINAVARRGEKVYLFFDELQDLPQWSAQLKSLVDNVSARTLVTGSSALRIARGRNSLAGRVSTIELGPLRLYEIAGIRGLGELPPFAAQGPLEDWMTKEFWIELGAHARKHSKALTSSFSHFSRLGGYPVCHQPKTAKVQLLAKTVVETVVTRTVEHDPLGSKIHPDRRLLTETFRRVCRYAGQSVTTRLIAEEIGNVLQVATPEAKVTKSIEFLVDAMLVHEVLPLELLQKKQRRPAKLCLCDHFVRNAFLQETIPIDPKELAGANLALTKAAGHLIESIIGYYLVGIPELDVAWFPERTSEPEVDFVLTIGTRRIPMEIKYRRRRLGRDHIGGVRAFCDKKLYDAPFGIVVTQNETGIIADNIVALPASALLLLT